jgi:hypothetical protein
MDKFEKKAKNYFIAGEIEVRIGNFDVACTNYFKSLAAINDLVLSRINLFPRDHNERFEMLKENFPYFYKITSSLFLTYRKTYTKEILAEETEMLKEKLKEAFKNAKIDTPTDFEVEESIKKALKK